MLEYFSFTTLTTLGFGDVVPETPTARFLAIWEVTCGQFYLAVLVAGLVNLRGSQEMVDSEES
jgi:voltage-gated potassium channel